MIARHNPIGMVEPVEHPFGKGEFFIRPEIGQVASENRELDIRLRIDVGDAALQIPNVRGPVERDMDVTQISELDGLVLRSRAERCAEQANGKKASHNNDSKYCPY